MVVRQLIAREQLIDIVHSTSSESNVSETLMKLIFNIELFKLVFKIFRIPSVKLEPLLRFASSTNPLFPTDGLQ